ncbi:nicotinate phosphoribosyltransferase [Subtercola boreus]|uniref:Nicotinate phosphoribosyltransferase n=1 Tax=Subtercola boreus TaxID=120213 RepID=A0A3E0WBN3_9MICO|nr:nicotinate phosphoribosyltransferase [Subtercola boreus]RFA20343.1 nicotinate phosphoribosyltransferase [Subtercola boreus]RFA20497.1 nicotinate phosphoribosyltransferase [Subtercola boreus]RFA26746.1 nicotinate phosphoribosyltransferase [Subtercola boreus]
MSSSTALLTDRYELTMLDAALTDATADRQCLFEVFARTLPHDRRYGVVAGTGRALELVRDFRFGEAELDWLRTNGVVSARTLDWLADYRFTGTIRGYREGELYFPGSPILTVEASFAEGVILETLILSVLNYDSSVAGAAARMVSAAAGRPLAEMGSRRTGERSAVAAARAAYIAGFAATSNLEAGRSWGVPTMGTAAHAFTLLHDTEEDAFRSQVEAMGPGTTLLIDTYDVDRATDLAVEVAGPALGAVRLDSGDLPALVASVRARLDALGNTATRITVTSDLDEYTIAALAATPVDSYGVGTSVVTGSGSVAAGMVYKLVAHRTDSGEWMSVAKRSAKKTSIGGRKNAVRQLDGDGHAVAEVLYVDADGDGSAGRGGAGSAGSAGSGADSESGVVFGERDLLVTLVENGVADEAYLGAAGVERARAHHRAAVAELPPGAFRLSRGGEAIIPTRYITD